MNMQMPEKVQIEEIGGPFHARFILNPLEEGYGVTMGNAFRRVLLSSIQGAAFVGLKISDVQHEFQTIPGVVEDVTEIILNLKEVRMRMTDKKAANRITFRVKGGGEWTAQSIADANAGIEVLEPNKKIATLAPDADFDVELRIGRGKGYVPAEEQNTTDFPVGMIAVDAIYTPIKNVIFTVEPYRVGQKTDYERLILDVHTDGSITAQEAVTQAADIIRTHVSLMLGIRAELGEGHVAEAGGPVTQDEKAKNEHRRKREILLRPVDELELSVRAHNCLKAANIRILADLVKLQEADLLKFRNFGRKSLAELNDVVLQNGLKFGMDVEPFLRDEVKEVAE